MHKPLGRLVWHQHWPLLLLILLGLIGSSAFQGLNGSQDWRAQSDPQVMASMVQYRRATHDYVDEVGQHYSSKQAFVKNYRQQHLQLYRQRPTKKTRTTRGNFGTQINQYFFIISILAGAGMIWYARRRYFNEFLQTMGYRRSAIYRHQVLQYGGAVIGGIVVGSVINLAILQSQIPAAFFAYFKWHIWIQDLTGDAVVGLCVFVVASLAAVAINNAIVASVLTLVMYLYWWLPQSVLEHESTAVARNYLSRNWLLGCGLALIIAVIAWGVTQWLVANYSSEQRSQIAPYRGVKLILLVVLSVPVGIFLSRIFQGLILSETSWPALILGWGLGLIGLSAWLYRPKWSQQLWRLVGQLR